MPELKKFGASLEVGFPNGVLPERFLPFRGRCTRAIDACPDFPFENAQFEAVIMDGAAVSRESVKEAHRVLKPQGWLFFTVPEKTRGQDGFTLSDVYAIVREGYNIVEAIRPAWWHFGRLGRTITIRAQKKNWRNHTNTYRPYV